MRILFTHLYDDRCGLGGAENLVLALLQGLRDQFGCEVACAVNRGVMADQLRSLDVPWFELARPKRSALTLVRQLGRILGAFEPAVAHSHHRYTTALLDAFYRHRTHILHTEHELRTSKKLLFRYGHFAVGVNPTISSVLVSHYAVPPDRVATVRNAIRAVTVDERQRANFAALKSGGILLGACPARLDPVKGHHLLLQALAKMDASSRRRLRLVFAGTGSLAAALKRQASRLKVATAVEFTGYSRHVGSLMAASDFVILGSQAEGTPLVALEAQQLGKPLIGFDVPGIRDLVQTAHSGLLVPYGDTAALAATLERLIAEPSVLATLASGAALAGREAPPFDQFVCQYHALYQRLAGEPCH